MVMPVMIAGICRGCRHNNAVANLFLLEEHIPIMYISH
jgi:hypothetical protein